MTAKYYDSYAKFQGVVTFIEFCFNPYAYLIEARILYETCSDSNFLALHTSDRVAVHFKTKLLTKEKCTLEFNHLT